MNQSSIPVFSLFSYLERDVMAFISAEPKTIQQILGEFDDDVESKHELDDDECGSICGFGKHRNVGDLLNTLHTLREVGLVEFIDIPPTPYNGENANEEHVLMLCGDHSYVTGSVYSGFQYGLTPAGQMCLEGLK